MTRVEHDERQLERKAEASSNLMILMSIWVDARGTHFAQTCSLIRQPLETGIGE